jgi:peptide/nickel transport system ATP-binding protein
VPTPDPSHRLDLHRLMEDRASDPAAWPEPFCRYPDAPLGLIEISSGHLVAARALPAAQIGGRARA